MRVSRIGAMNRKGGPWSLLAIVGAIASLLVSVPAVTVSASPTIVSTVTRVGAGAARLTVLPDGAGKLYVNLRSLAPGRWNEHLYSGTCENLGSRVAVLPGLIIPASGAVARTNALTASQASGKTLRLVSSSGVLCSTFGAAAFAPSGLTETATVVRVVDGDTIVVDRGLGEETLRYIGIDTPETVHPSQPVEWMGLEASNENKRLVEGRQVVLEKDVSDLDFFGRLLRYVWLQSGASWSMVNLSLVAGGFAQVSTYPPDIKYVDLLLEGQRVAREQARGLWGIAPPSATPTAPPLAQPTPPTSGACDPAYPSVCIRPAPPDLDCGQIPYRRFTVLPPDPHRFDGDHDGIGCESG